MVLLLCVSGEETEREVKALLCDSDLGVFLLFSFCVLLCVTSMKHCSPFLFYFSQTSPQNHAHFTGPT